MKRQNFLKGSLILMMSAAAAKVLGAMFRIPLTNMLGGVGMSYFSCAYSLFMPVYAVTVTGLSSAVARMTAQSAALGMYRNVRKIRKTALCLFTAVGLFGSVITALLAKPFCEIAADCPQGFTAVLMISPSVLFGCITSVERGYYEGLSNMYPTAVSQVVEGAVKLTAGLLLCGYVMSHRELVTAYFPYCTDIRAAAAAAGILGVTLSSAGAMIFFAAVRLFGGSRLPDDEPTVMSGREIVHELAVSALPSGISSLVTNLTALTDMVTVIACISYTGTVLPVGVTAEEYPHFVYGSFAGIAITVFNLVPSVTNMLGRGILPTVTAAWESRDRRMLAESSSQALLTAAAIAVPLAAGMGVLSEEILGILFPHQPDEAALCVNSLRIMMPGMVCLCISYPLFSMLQAAGHAGDTVSVMLWGAMFKLVCNFLLIPRMGLSGIAASTGICYAVIFLLALRRFRLRTGIRLRVIRISAGMFAGAVLCAAAARFCWIWMNARFPHRLSLLTAVVAGGIVYLVWLIPSACILFRKKAAKPF